MTTSNLFLSITHPIGSVSVGYFQAKLSAPEAHAAALEGVMPEWPDRHEAIDALIDMGWERDEDAEGYDSVE